MHNFFQSPNKSMGQSNFANDKVHFSSSAVAGAVSGVVVRLIISPLDVIKIRLQLNRQPPNYRRVTTFSIVRSIVINEGVLGFWKGNLPAEIMYLIYGGVQFSSYTAIKKKLSSAGPHDLVSLISGGLSGTIATAISYPFDTIRTRLAADSTKGFQNLGNIIRKVYAQESIYGFYGGIRPTIYQIFLGTATSFWTYEKLRQLQGVGGFETAIVPASGFLAGSVSKLVTFPLDSIKRRLQVTGSSRLLEQGGYTYLKKGSYSSNLFTVAYKIIRNEGVLSLYRGAGLTLVKSGIATSLSFSMYELVVGYLK